MHAARRPDRLRPRKAPRQSRSRTTVDAILEAAAQVFTTHGYAAGTTNRIAARAGVSIGSLYEYFPNKDALLVALMERHVAEGERVLASAAAATAATSDLDAVVRTFVRAMVRLHARDRALHRVLFEEAPFPRAVRRSIEELEVRVIGVVEAYLRAHPERTRRDPARAAMVVVHAIEGLTHKLVVHGPARLDIEPYVDEMVALVVAYLAADD
jgi:AcrR family transcriptional regulator